jgi:hypothetical protein
MANQICFAIQYLPFWNITVFGFLIVETSVNHSNFSDSGIVQTTLHHLTTRTNLGLRIFYQNNLSVPASVAISWQKVYCSCTYPQYINVIF